MKTISAADANRLFSRVLRDVREGESFIVTSRGQPVARIVPAATDEAKVEARRRARTELLAHIRTRPALGLGRFDRDDLYDD